MNYIQKLVFYIILKTKFQFYKTKSFCKFSSYYGMFNSFCFQQKEFYFLTLVIYYSVFKIRVSTTTIKLWKTQEK